MASTIQAGIYTRISSDPDGTAQGVTRQLEDCRKLAEARGWRVVDEYVDNDVSAYSGKRRPQYERLMADVTSGRIGAVVVYNMDRLTRRPIDLEEFASTCEAAGVTKVASVTADIDLGNDDGLFMARILAAIAAKESGRKSARMKRKHQQRAEQGLPNHGGANRPFGYAEDRVTIDPVEADVIRTLAARAIAGESLRSLAGWLDDQGIRTVQGNPWRTPTLRAMLTSPRVIGKRSYEGQIVADATWAPILSPETQEAVVARFESRRITGRRAPRRYALSGMLRCGKCGSTLYSSIRVNSRRYVCLSGADHQGCGRLTVVAGPVEELVAAYVLHRLDSPELTAALIAPDTATGMELGAELDAAEARKRELAEMLGAQEIDRKGYLEASRVIDARIFKTKRAMAERVHARGLADLIGTGAELRASWDTLNLARQAAILQTLIDHVVILPGVSGARSLDPNRVQPVWIV
jgi:DNA invertase Pin-like site-specific DNA recombinase